MNPNFRYELGQPYHAPTYDYNNPWVQIREYRTLLNKDPYMNENSYVIDELEQSAEDILQKVIEARDSYLAKFFNDTLCYETRWIPIDAKYKTRIETIVSTMRHLHEKYRALPVEQCIHEISIKWERARYTWAVGLDDRKVRYRLGGANCRPR